MLIKLIRYDDFVYGKIHNGKVKRISLTDIGQLIREGHSISAVYNDYDCTKETLTHIAFRPVLHTMRNRSPNILDSISYIIEEDLLYTIIENGDILEYMKRKGDIT